MCSSGDVQDYVLLYFHVHFLVFVLPCELLNKIYALKTQADRLYSFLHAIVPMKAQGKRHTGFLKFLIVIMDPQAP